MTSQFISRSLAVLTFLFTSAMVAPLAAHASPPTVKFLSPGQKACIPVGKAYNIKVEVTGPVGMGGTLTFQFPLAPPDQQEKKIDIILDKGSPREEVELPGGPHDSSGTSRACVSVHFGTNKSTTLCREWYIKTEC